MNPTTPQAERGVVRPPSRETTPSDGPPHKFYMLPPLVDNQNVSQSINLGLPGPTGEPNSDRSSSNTQVAMIHQGPTDLLHSLRNMTVFHMFRLQ